MLEAAVDDALSRADELVVAQPQSLCGAGRLSLDSMDSSRTSLESFCETSISFPTYSCRWSIDS